MAAALHVEISSTEESVMSIPPPQSVGLRAMSTGTCIALIAVGAILRYAVSATSSHGVNIHVVGLIVLLAGVLGLLLSLVVWGPLNPARRRANDPVSYEARTPPGPPGGQERPLYRDEQPR
jgi:hypothetical protein